MPQYLIRLDDACETMSSSKWQRMFDLLHSYSIKPLVGVIPANADPEQRIDKPDPDFWLKVRSLAKQGAEICMHGYCHVYEQEAGGIHPVNHYSEFAGGSLQRQREKIAKAINLFQKHGVIPRVFFAPAHTFDSNTLKALELETDIRIISDTVATRPYRMGAFLFVPQQIGRCRAIPFGTVTFCYHPNTMTAKDFKILEQFLERYHSRFCSLSEVLEVAPQSSKTLFDRLLTRSYFFARKARSAFV